MKQGSISDKIWNAAIGFLFSTPGLAILAFFGTSVMILLTYLTEPLKPYAPFSYGIAGLVSAFLLLGVMFIVLMIRDRFIARRATFVEIDVGNATLGLLKTSNIEDLRSFVFGDLVVYMFTFEKPIRPAPVIHVEGMRNGIPKIEKQYVSKKAACIFLRAVGPEQAFRLTFNKSFDE